MRGLRILPKQLSWVFNIVFGRVATSCLERRLGIFRSWRSLMVISIKDVGEIYREADLAAEARTCDVSASENAKAEA
jgi:hypothetical protein